MHTYFISDLHLSDKEPQLTSAFISFLHTQAPTAERLYLLGDLFEFWIGDDAAPLLGASPILSAMKTLADKIDCYFIAGNRDFLVGNDFSTQTGFKILDDETIIDLYGIPTLLLHGDSLCTDDLPHQQFRQTMVTNKEWRKNFLKLSIPERIEQAQKARMESNIHKSNISMEIMDVTESSVINAFKKNNVSQMIHGHTHRQNSHSHQIDQQTIAKRYVLGDWKKTNSILIAHDNQSINIKNDPI